MAATHSTDQEIMETIRAIARKGVRPTVKILHRILDGGTSQRLSYFIKLWKKEYIENLKNGNLSISADNIPQPLNTDVLHTSSVSDTDSGPAENLLDNINTFLEKKYAECIRTMHNLEMRLKESEEAEKKSRAVAHRMIEEYSRLLSEHRACIIENKAQKDKLFKIYNYLSNKNIGLNTQQIEIV